MHLYNTRSRKIEEFKPLNEGILKMYSCGPTVYDFIHIGNIRSFMMADIIKKSFKYFGYTVDHVMNITDFGHLSGDSDDGEDKMMLGLKRENLPNSVEGMKKLADIYTEYFLQDIKKMNFELPNKMPRAIEYIAEYMEMIKELDMKGFVYSTSDGLYFDTVKDANYGKMMNIKSQNDNESSESRIGVNSEKKSPRDFALFKFQSELGFDTAYGCGFPGWHIECSGMSKKFLGKSFDIHTGGIDNLLHHTNEIAQSENANEATYATFFCHCEHININDEKMSKSKNNFIKIKDIEEAKIDPLSYRYFLLTSHYRQNTNFSWDSLRANEVAYFKLRNYFSELKASILHDEMRAVGKKLANNMEDRFYLNKFESFLNDDISTPKALALLFDIMKDDELIPSSKIYIVEKMDEVLSLDLTKKLPTPDEKIFSEIEKSEIEILINERNKYRADKNWAKSDELRNKLQAMGVVIEDK